MRPKADQTIPLAWRRRRWTIEPICDEIARRLGADYSYHDAAELIGIHPDTWGRSMRRGYICGDVLADQIATRLEHHPALFWPEWYSVSLDGLVTA